MAFGERHGRPVIVSGSIPTVRVWDLESGATALGPLTGHDDWVHVMAVGGRRGQPVIVSGGRDGTAQVSDLESSLAPPCESSSSIECCRLLPPLRFLSFDEAPVPGSVGVALRALAGDTSSRGPAAKRAPRHVNRADTATHALALRAVRG